MTGQCQEKNEHPSQKSYEEHLRHQAKLNPPIKSIRWLQSMIAAQPDLTPATLVHLENINAWRREIEE